MTTLPPTHTAPRSVEPRLRAAREAYEKAVAEWLQGRVLSEQTFSALLDDVDYDSAYRLFEDEIDKQVAKGLKLSDLAEADRGFLRRAFNRE